MHPTIDEQLDGIARLVEQAAGRIDDGPTAERLRTAAGTLRRIAGGWSAVLPYLTWDNAATLALLESLGDRRPGSGGGGRPLDPLDAGAVHARNLELRALLAEAVRGLPPAEVGGGPASRGPSRRGRARPGAHRPRPLRRPSPPGTLTYPHARPPPTPRTRRDLRPDLRPAPLPQAHDRRRPSFDEQFPLAPIDDWFIHQTTDPIRVMMFSDPRAYERSWMVCHDDSGEILVATGLSFYPNLDRAEAYAIVNHRGIHRTVRAFRRLGADRMDLRLGPIAPVVLEGMRRWLFVLEPNEWGISFELDFRDTTRQVFREPTLPVDRGFPRGRRPDVTTGFESCRRGRPAGSTSTAPGWSSPPGRAGAAGTATGASAGAWAGRSWRSGGGCTSACPATASWRSATSRSGATRSSTPSATPAPAPGASSG